MTGEEAGPILRHAVETVADGAPWQYELAYMSGTIISQFAPKFGVRVSRRPSHPGSNLPKSPLPAEAPARTLAEKTKAFADEHGKSFAQRTMGSYGVNVKNVTWLKFSKLVGHGRFVNAARSPVSLGLDFRHILVYDSFIVMGPRNLFINPVYIPNHALTIQ